MVISEIPKVHIQTLGLQCVALSVIPVFMVEMKDSPRHSCHTDARPFFSEKGGRTFKNVSRFRHALCRHAHTLGPYITHATYMKMAKEKQCVSTVLT